MLITKVTPRRRTLLGRFTALDCGRSISADGSLAYYSRCSDCIHPAFACPISFDSQRFVCSIIGIIVRLFVEYFNSRIARIYECLRIAFVTLEKSKTILNTAESRERDTLAFQRCSCFCDRSLAVGAKLSELNVVGGIKTSIFNRGKPKSKPITKADLRRWRNHEVRIEGGHAIASIDGLAVVLRIEEGSDA